MTMIDEKLEPIFDEVVRRNAGEPEFHQAVREVLESLGRGRGASTRATSRTR